MNQDNYPPDWEKRRRAVFRRDRWECRGCGHESQSGEGLHAHHTVPISEGGGHELENLMTLCEGCHQTVHSSRQSPPLEPIQTYPCAVCDGEYVEGESFKGSFCSERCWLSHKADKAIDGVEEHARICATCFSNYPPGDDVCPSCGNWDPSENKRAELEDVDVDVKNLVVALLKQNHLR